MRFTALLPLCLAVSTPALAQPPGGISGIDFNIGTPMSSPITGYGDTGVISSSLSPWDYSNIEKAQKLIATGQYAEADGILTKLVGRTSSKRLRFLKGVSRLGMGDAAGARRYFERSLSYGRGGSPGVLSGLAIAEIRLGNRDAAENILQKLRNQQKNCASNCERAKPIDDAVIVVEKALA
jgi:tetratricopeptide (TPR) repeat protein